MTNTNKAIWALRIGVAGEFLGHGILALVGAMDILVALIVLFKPIKPILLWAIFWGFWTALVRPIVGQPIWDFIERFANWGAPLALFFLLLKSGKSD